MVNDDLAAKTLREKCVKGDALRMVRHLDDLQEIWDKLDTCLERPEKYMEESLRPIVEFRKYKAADSCAVREFYSLLRVAIKGAKGIGRLSLLINDQTIPRIMGKMPYTDWKEWATRRPEWLRENLGPTFERFVERKWQDALNVAAAEPQLWGLDREKTGAWMERPPTKCPVNILSQTKCPLNILPHVTFCPSDILSPIYNVPRFYVHP